MREQKLVITCDVCKVEKLTDEKPIKYQVIFSNEQTEGRTCKPYLSEYALDLCQPCLSVMLKGNMLFGEGAMGHNKFYFSRYE